MKHLIASTLLLCCLLGCSADRSDNRVPADVQAALAQPDRFVLHSLNPDPRHAPKDEQSEDNFHGYLVLGSTEITDPAEQKKPVEALYQGVEENEGVVADCFNPRHGIRVEAGGKTFDLVICFECYSASIYVNGEEGKGVLVTDSPQPTFDAALQAAGIELPKQAD